MDTPKAAPINDPTMDVNQHYEQESERPQQVSDDQPIQLAQNTAPVIGPTAETHNIVQAPNGARIAFPKEMPADQMHQEMSTYWDRLTKDNPLLQGPVDSAKFLAHEVHGAAQTIIGLPSAIVDSIVVEPTEHEKQQFGITGKPSRAQQAALAMYRNIGAPIENAAQWYGTAVKHNQRIIDLIPADVLAEGIGTGAGAAVLSKFIEGEGAETPAMGQETPTTAAATYAGTERRAGARTLTTSAENELAMKNRRLQDISNPFDHTEGASATMNRDEALKALAPPEAKGQTFYHGANAEGTKAIERTGAINPDAFSQAHLTPEKSTADAYARANGGKTFSVNEKDIPPDVLQQYKDTGRGPMVLNSEHTVPVNEAAPQSALAPEYKDLGNGLHEVSTPAAEGSSNGHLLARDVEGNPDAARVGHHWVDADSRGQGMGSAQLAKMAQSLADKGKTTLLSDLDMTAGAKRSWDNLQTQYPDAVSKAGNGYIFDLTKLKPDADAEALKNALSGSAGENALFEKAKAELGPDATASEVAQRAQEMKTGTPAPKTAPNTVKTDFAPATADEYAKDNHANGQAATLTSPEDMKPGTKFYTNGEGVSYAISPDGDLQGVVNNSEKKGGLAAVVPDAIRNGAKTLDAWDLYLPKQYEKYGFERTENIPYDENTFGTPNQALQDAWKKQGWKEGDPYPGVQFMKLKNSARKSVMKEGQPIAKKEEKKKPFAAPEQNMEAANFKQRLNDKMTAALA